jgi:hypothetical protein
MLNKSPARHNYGFMGIQVMKKTTLEFPGALMQQVKHLLELRIAASREADRPTRGGSLCD